VAYEGEIMDRCGAINIDFSTTYIVAVSGDGPNVCGHLLLYAVGKDSDVYFHVAGLKTFPHYMDSDGYRRYLRETGKRELVRRQVDIPYPDRAYLEVERQLSEKWTWLVLPHNCVAFCEDVISAGGGDWGSYSNCPAVATLDAQLQQIYTQLSSNIEDLYGVPH
jgi:hypothetical protein